MLPFARPLLLAVIALSLAGCGLPTKGVRFVVRDAQDGRPLPLVRVRAGPLSTNEIPLPVSLTNLAESNDGLKDSALTDDRGQARLSLYTKKPSLIEVTPVDLRSADLDGPVPAWIYDPRDRTLTRVDAFGVPSGIADQIDLALDR